MKFRVTNPRTPCPKRQKQPEYMGCCCAKREEALEVLQGIVIGHLMAEDELIMLLGKER